MVDDFRNISISPVLSKIFKHCILGRFSSFLATTDNQFGFKKGLSCSHATYSIRNVIDEYVSEGSTANVFVLDLSKAFYRTNHFALFIKLMNINSSVNLLAVIEKWFAISVTCDRFSNFLIWCQEFDKIMYYPHHYSLYMWMTLLRKLLPVVSAVICHLFAQVFFCMLMICSLIAPSVHTLQIMLNIC